MTIIDSKKLQKEAINFLEVQMRQATRAWLRAVIKKIPRYTGTARGTFKPLGRVLRVAIKAAGAPTHGSAEGAKRKKFIKIGGRLLPTGPSAGELYSDFKFSKTKNTVSFEFDQNLPYVIWNSIYPAPVNFILPSNPPWFAFAAGEAAFKNYVKVELPKKAKFKKFVRRVKINA